MRAKLDLKTRAIYLRENGLSYSEIIKQITVSKSSLSLWLQNNKLDQLQQTRLIEKQKTYRKLGSIAKHTQSLKKIAKITQEFINQINNLDEEKLFLIGIALYWAEGTKARGSNLSQGVEFTNSDPDMCKLFLNWLIFPLKIAKEDIKLSVYINETQRESRDKIITFWSDRINFSKSQFQNIYYTRNNYVKAKERNRIDTYYGQLRIKVKKSTDLNRKIHGWKLGIIKKSSEINY